MELSLFLFFAFLAHFQTTALQVHDAGAGVQKSPDIQPLSSKLDHPRNEGLRNSVTTNSESRPHAQRISKSKKTKKERKGSKNDGSKSGSYGGNSGYSISSNYNRANRKSYGDSDQGSSDDKKGRRGDRSGGSEDGRRFRQRFMHGFYDPFHQMSFYK